MGRVQVTEYLSQERRKFPHLSREVCPVGDIPSLGLAKVVQEKSKQGHTKQFFFVLHTILSLTFKEGMSSQASRHVPIRN